MLVVTDGGVPGHADSADWTAPDDHPLVNAYGWFCHLWAESAPVEPPRFAVGDDVMTVPAGQEAKVRRRDFTGGTWWYQVRVDGQSVVMRQAQLTRPDIDDDPFAWMTRPASSARRFAATLSRAKLRDHLSDTLYSFRATRTIFRPYQFRPVIRLLATGSLRLLIADEVGLGKTIEAGLVWTELDARNQASRVLVVCPSMLVPKWCAEMEERFGYHLAELRRDGLDDLLARVESDRLPARYHAVCGLERLRGWPGLEQLAEIGPHFDLVIVDEAHAFRNADTKSHALGALLAEWGDALVFLSATPLNLGNEDLFNLLSLLAPGEFDNAFVLEQQLQPNAVLNRIGASLLDRGTDNATRRAMVALDGRPGLRPRGRVAARLRRPRPVAQRTVAHSGRCRRRPPHDRPAPRVRCRRDPDPQSRDPRPQGGTRRGVNRGGVDSGGSRVLPGVRAVAASGRQATRPSRGVRHPDAPTSGQLLPTRGQAAGH